MNSLDYLCEVRRTMSPATTSTTILLGLLGESGEVCDLVKKVTAHGHPIERDKFVKELGDVLWYVGAAVMQEHGSGLNALHHMGPVTINNDSLKGLAIDLSERARDLGVQGPKASSRVVIGTIQAIGALLNPPAPLSEIMETNVAKLRARYPEGWDAARSPNRGPE